MTENSTRTLGTQRPDLLAHTDREPLIDLWRRDTDRSRTPHDIIILANRLPVTIDAGKTQRSPGGLVSALTSACGKRTRWIGWPGSAATVPDECTIAGHRLNPVHLTDDETSKYYDGFCNSVLWPLFHGRLQPVEFDRDWWDAYLAVNERFAEAAVRHAPHGSTVWVHDYHLLLTPAMIREARPDLHLGLFLHIPFPAPQLMAVLPWREQIIDGMLGADLIGFQTSDDADRFRAVADRYGSTPIVEHTRGAARGSSSRRSEVGVFPISVDFDHWDRLGIESADASISKRDALAAATLLLGVDRLDYTKGITRRVEAFGELLDEGLLSAAECILVQVAVPSRTSVDAYESEQKHLQLAVDAVNDRHPRPDGSDVVRVIHSNLGPEELAEWYRAADVMLVTPFADGMNLVAKEFIASRSDLDGALILSEFAGSAKELASGALLVNPYDIDSIKHAVLSAIGMPASDRSNRMRAMRAVVRTNNVERWANRFLRRLDAAVRGRAPHSQVSPGQQIAMLHAAGRTGLAGA